MKIGIDARFLTHPQHGGFKTYTEQLIRALAAVDSTNEYVLYLDRAPDAECSIPPRPNFELSIVGGTLPFAGMPVREQIALPLRARRDRLDLLHSPSLTAPLSAPCPSVVTIHDTIWLAPERYGRATAESGKRSLMQRYYRFVTNHAARRAAMVITVSHAARRCIIEQLGVPGDRVRVTHAAASPDYRKSENVEELARVRNRYSIGRHFVLALGSADPRKNVATLLRSYAGLPQSLRDAHELAIVWTHTHLAGDIAALAVQLGIRDRIRFLTGVSNDDLRALYSVAQLFVFPSRYEGFGLPVLEAMACGTPVVAANNSSIPEIAGQAALLVDAEDGAGLTSQMAKVLGDRELRARLTAAGLARARSFSWQRCARETIAAYEAALPSRPRTNLDSSRSQGLALKGFT